jgi:GTPase
MSHKAGFVNILGSPNVGKSTLMNLLVGEKLSIITPKVQTTRHRILGILNEEDYQIVFSDTPGIITPHYKLHESMMTFVDSALKDADVFIYIIESGQNKIRDDIIERIQKTKKPLLFVINKIDLSDQEKIMKEIEKWQKAIPETEIIPISALKSFNVEKLMQSIIDKLPVSPPFYPKDELTDKPVRFFISEMIREKVLLYYQKEIPYSVEVVINEYKEDEKIIRIRCNIFVSRESQKGIILGHKGAAIKRLGTEARKDIEKFVDKQVFLDITVKVSKDWRDKENELKKFGYLD